MKENRLGPRQWAFVVVAGGAVFAFPFMQRQPEVRPTPPVVDVEATLLPEATIAAPSTVVASQSAGGSEAVVPTWPTLPHSPFDELVQQKAMVPEAKPAEEIVPMLPLRPWISAPNLPGGSSSNTLASTQSTSSNLPSTSLNSVGKSNNAIAMASPWREDNDASHDASVKPSTQVVQSYGHGRRQLPVNAGPADQYTYEEIAQKLNLPKQESVSQELVSAIVPPDQVLPVPTFSAPQPASLAAQSLPTHSPVPQPTEPRAEPRSTLTNVPKSSVVLSRQPAARPTGAQIRFGQANELTTPASNSHINTDTAHTMAPLPPLPAERRGHIIMQPIRQ